MQAQQQPYGQNSGMNQYGLNQYQNNQSNRNSGTGAGLLGNPIRPSNSAFVSQHFCSYLIFWCLLTAWHTVFFCVYVIMIQLPPLFLHKKTFFGM